MSNNIFSSNTIEKAKNMLNYDKGAAFSHAKLRYCLGQCWGTYLLSRAA